MANDNQGPKGDKGDPGPQGPPGRDGCDYVPQDPVDPFGPLTTEQQAHLVCCVLEHTRPSPSSMNGLDDPVVLAARQVAAQKAIGLLQ